MVASNQMPLHFNSLRYALIHNLQNVNFACEAGETIVQYSLFIIH